MFFKKIDTLITYFENISVVVCLSIASVLAFTEVILRYVFQTSLIWSSELVVVSIIWAVFLGLSITLRKGGHIKVDIVVNLLSGRWRTGVIFVGSLIGVLFSFFLFYYSIKYAVFLRESGEVSITTDIPDYLYFMALPVGGLLLTIRYIQELVKGLKAKREDDKT